MTQRLIEEDWKTHVPLLLVWTTEALLEDVYLHTLLRRKSIYSGTETIRPFKVLDQIFSKMWQKINISNQEQVTQELLILMDRREGNFKAESGESYASAEPQSAS